jgi:hypothetical protein
MPGPLSNKEQDVDADKLSKVPLGLPRLRYMMKHERALLAQMILGTAAVIYVLVAFWPF